MNSVFQGGLYPRGEARLALGCGLRHSPQHCTAVHTLSRARQPGPDAKPMKTKKNASLVQQGQKREDPTLRFPLDYGLDPPQISNKVGVVAITNITVRHACHSACRDRDACFHVILIILDVSTSRCCPEEDETGCLNTEQRRIKSSSSRDLCTQH